MQVFEKSRPVTSRLTFPEWHAQCTVYCSNVLSVGLVVG